MLVFGVFFLHTKLIYWRCSFFIIFLKYFCVIFWIRTRNFGRGTSGPWSRSGSWCSATRDLGRIGFGRGFILGRGFVLGRILGDLVSRDLVISLLKHKPNWIGPFVLNIDLYINNKYLSIYKLLKQWMSNRKYPNKSRSAIRMTNGYHKRICDHLRLRF